jgi:hypothetical protein
MGPKRCRSVCFAAGLTFLPSSISPSHLPTDCTPRTRPASWTVTSSRRTAAQSLYREFLTLWESAEIDVPILAQAKAEYAKFQ